jgi:hypothetical protein
VVCAVLYMCHVTSCVMLQQKRALRVCESRVQGEVFGSEGKGVTGDW